MSPILPYEESKEYPVAKSLNELRSQIHSIFQKDNVNIEQVKSMMESYKSNPEEWNKFAKFDQYRLTRNLVDEGNGKFNLILVCWEGGHRSSIHDHSDSHCFMKIMQGSLREIRYDWPKSGEDKGLQENARLELPTDDVSYMNDSLGLHLMENTNPTQRAVSLHLYSPPIKTCQMFDKTNGNSTTCKIAFWSKFGERISDDSDIGHTSSNTK